MEKSNPKYQAYVNILKEELVPAMGCTEPIALAYAACTAKKVLDGIPDSISVEVSGSIIKNVKSVIVPHTGHLKGIKAAVIAGIVAGDPDEKLECIAHADQNQVKDMRQALIDIPIKISYLDDGHVFDIIIKLIKGQDHVRVRITDYHTNIVLIERNQEILFKKDLETEPATETDRTLLDMEDIWDFINTVDVADIQEILERQIAYNTAISEEGLTHDYGANIGKVLLASGGDSIENRAKAKAAAGSDARMNGCELPVVINSGSGNQGITVSVPVIEYAKEYKVSHEKLLRALALSNLVAIHEKTGIGTLSAYCGAVSAGAGAGAGIVYITGGDYQDMIHTVVNDLAIVSGIICDGAKASCAAKIASSVDAAILGYNMYKHHQEFKGGDGIVVKGIENTIANVGRLGKEGMKQTNEEIIDMMIQE